MVKFYELWNPKDGKPGFPTATALKQAQEFIRSHDKWKHSYYWAAWVLWGLRSGSRAPGTGGAQVETRSERPRGRLSPPSEARMRPIVLAAVALMLVGCGQEEDLQHGAPNSKPRAENDLSWAQVSKEQIAEASRIGMPVAFENSIGMRFVLIPAGEFVMGSPATEAGRLDDERQHQVALSRAWYMQTTETTILQFRRHRQRHPDPNAFDSVDGPAESTYDEASKFVRWLRATEAREYAMPTEAQWEYACRAGTTTPFSFGASISPEQANYDARWAYGGGPTGARSATTKPVGSYAPNAWGLYDMHGNAWEWCSDWYGDYASAPAADPIGPSLGYFRVRRGGCHATGPDALRSAFHSGHHPEEMGGGFRVAVLLAGR